MPSAYLRPSPCLRGDKEGTNFPVWVSLFFPLFVHFLTIRSETYLVERKAKIDIPAPKHALTRKFPGFLAAHPKVCQTDSTVRRLQHFVETYAKPTLRQPGC